MANLNNLTDKIIEEANIKAEEILKRANEEATLKRQEIAKKIEDKRNSILEKAKIEGELIKERVNSSANLESRDELLKAKGNVINRVIELTKSKLENLNEEDFISYFKSKINESSLKEDSKVLVSSKYINRVKEILPSANVVGDDNIKGFLIDNNGIIENYSFSKLLEFQKDDIEEMVAKLLFK